MRYPRPCFHKLIVGCSNDDKSSKGTWVAGDGVPLNDFSQAVDEVRFPTIVTGFGLYNCSTGAEIVPGDLDDVPSVATADLCWGKSLPTRKRPRAD